MTCRHHPDDRTTVLTLNQHLDPLPADHPADCPGCLTCERRHCTVCCRHLDIEELQTCTTCRGRVRRDLTACLDLAALLPDHALHAARDAHLVAADPIPGGDAIMLISRGSEGLSDDGKTNPGDPEPISFVLAWWEEQWRQALGHPSRPAPWQRRADHTITDAHAYLDRHLTWAATHHPGFHVFARDLATTRRALEELLNAGDQPAEGVACFRCNTTLVRDYRDPKRCRHATEAQAAGHPLRDWLRILASYPELGPEHTACDQGGLIDPTTNTGWRCPRCRRTYTPGEYQLAVKATYAEHAPALPATELAARLDVAPATIWSWAQRGHIRRRGRGPDRRTLYDVHDTLRHAGRQEDAR